MLLNKILFFSIALLFIAVTLLFSLMHIKRRDNKPPMFAIETDTNQKNKVLIACIIIDIATIVVYGIIIYIVFFLMTFNWLYTFMIFLGMLIMTRNLYKTQYEVFADHFKRYRGKEKS